VADVEQFLSEAPDGVVDAVRWLLARGGQPTSVEHRHGMGFALLELACGSVELRVVSDRDEWHLDLRKDGGGWLQFDLIYVLISGDESSWEPRTTALVQPFMHPVGVSSWTQRLGQAVDWLRDTDDAAEQVASAGRRRAAVLFG
jgi:hypothetical protein